MFFWWTRKPWIVTSSWHTHILVLGDDIGEEGLVNLGVVPLLLHGQPEEHPLLLRLRLVGRVNGQDAVRASLLLLEELKGFRSVTGSDNTIRHLANIFITNSEHSIVTWNQKQTKEDSGPPVSSEVWKVGSGGEMLGGFTWAVLRRLLPAGNLMPTGFPNNRRIFGGSSMFI